MSSFTVFGLIGKRQDARAARTLAQIAVHLRERIVHAGRGALLAPDDLRLDIDAPGIERVPDEVFGRRCELAIVVGGDGTLLSAGRRLAPHGRDHA